MRSQHALREKGVRSLYLKGSQEGNIFSNEKVLSLQLNNVPVSCVCSFHGRSCRARGLRQDKGLTRKMQWPQQRANDLRIEDGSPTAKVGSVCEWRRVSG